MGSEWGGSLRYTMPNRKAAGFFGRYHGSTQESEKGKEPRGAPSCRIWRFHACLALARLYFAGPWAPWPQANPL